MFGTYEEMFVELSQKIDGHLIAMQSVVQALSVPDYASIVSAVAAVFAIGVALYVAYKQNEIARKQTEIAARQAEISEQQSKIALFEKRYDAFYMLDRLKYLSGTLTVAPFSKDESQNRKSAELFCAYFGTVFNYTPKLGDEDSMIKALSILGQYEKVFYMTALLFYSSMDEKKADIERDMRKVFEPLTKLTVCVLVHFQPGDGNVDVDDKDRIDFQREIRQFWNKYGNEMANELRL